MNKYNYFNKNSIKYKKDDSNNYIHNNSCCQHESGLGSHKSLKPGGLTSASKFKTASTGTLTINNTELVIKIFIELSEGYKNWYYGNRRNALKYFKQATLYFEDLQYDEPSSFFIVLTQHIHLLFIKWKIMKNVLK